MATVVLGVVILPSVTSAQAAAEEASRFVKSKDGTSIAYEQSGSGPVVVLVAGALALEAAARLPAKVKRAVLFEFFLH